jgi:RNA polymerase sigma factor (sigma-70 family)
MARRLFFRLLMASQPAGEHVADAELLRRFAADRDSAAFELVLRRHADAVWTACRRILSSDADAEDAFQATFLVLMRKAGSIRNSSVGGWLHRVAVNAALKLKETKQGRQGIEAIPGSGAQPDAIASDREVAARVQMELARLPARYRLPVVLCDLEGQTHAEAAMVLDWPIGSVSGRLSRAHALLRERLARRGIVGPALLSATLTASPQPASAINGVAAIVGGADVPPPVSILVEGVYSAMKTARLKLVAVVAASMSLVALAGIGAMAGLSQPPAPIPRAKGEPPRRRRR